MSLNYRQHYIQSTVTLLDENFNGASSQYSTTNSSTGGTASNAAWTLRPNNYAYSSSFWTFTGTTNDATGFILTNSDSQGSPGTNLTLTYITFTNPFSLVGFTNVNLNLRHYLRYIGGNIARIQYSTDNGANWNSLQTFIANQGTSTNFANTNISMNSLIGQSSVKIRIMFQASWDYGWAINNITITAT